MNYIHGKFRNIKCRRNGQAVEESYCIEGQEMNYNQLCHLQIIGNKRLQTR